MINLILIILVFFISNSFSQDLINYNGSIIEHCSLYNSDENFNNCAKCESNYFLFFNDLLCIPCNDSTYGQIGCEGNCDSTNYINTRFAFCEKEGCKSGFYNLNGLCKNCSEGSPGCANCTYEVQEEETKLHFICHNCESNEYRLTEFGTCEHCKIDNCLICHYNEDSTKAVCDKCKNGYYSDLNGECQKCKLVYISGGKCYNCTNNNIIYDSSYCWCNAEYTLLGNSTCVKCNKGCSQCNYNNITKKLECSKCQKYYVLNSDNNCIYCGDGCETCSLNENNNPICKTCISGKFLDNNKCLICSEGCLKCQINESSLYKNESICTECGYYYALNPEKKCTECRKFSEIGGWGCGSCSYNEKNDKYECLSCRTTDYVYINNTFQCLSNTNRKQLYLYGCSKAFYKEDSDTYECFKCVNSFELIQITNDKTCRKLDEIGLSLDCLEVENLGSIENPIYSCKKCKNFTAHIKINSKGVKNCYPRSDYFSFCLEGEIKNGSNICNKCVENAEKNSTGICNCNYDSFGKYNQWCYKCDDRNYGNLGCDAEKGCTYFHSNDELNCNKCKNGYFEYTRGQCFFCKNEISNCDKCHFDKELKCDKCDDIYSLNEEKNKCLLDDCQEYLEISDGCIICKDKLDEYKSNKKCQSCKYGYFKTKNETCVLCRAEKYGGPACYECGYETDENNEETDNIICKDCFSFKDNYESENRFHFILTSNGKCYDCKNYLSESCLRCDIIKDKENNDKFICTVCALGYYLNSEGKCISYVNDLEKFPNCKEYNFIINNTTFIYYIYNIYYFTINFENSYDILLYYNNFSIYNEALKNVKHPIKTTCQECESRYFLNEEQKCESINFEKCKGSFIIQNITERLSICQNICKDKSYLNIYLRINNEQNIDFDYNKINNISFNYNEFYSLSDILKYFDRKNNETKNLVKNMNLCLNQFSDTKMETQFDGCSGVVYIPKTKLYHCINCKSGYLMNYNNNLCIKVNEYDKFNCLIENIGTLLSPIFSCKTCYYNYYTMVILENGIKLCVNDKILENCIEAKANTSYINTLYNCISCKVGTLLFYSKYYGRQICQNVFEKITTNKTISLETFEREEYILPDDMGICRENYFTPDGKKCYKCDNKNVGSPGCKGECSFSLKRNNSILCESECKEGYIETSKGICEKCESVDENCLKCHYENYPIDYIGIKRARKFQCDLCKNCYIVAEDGKCLSFLGSEKYKCEKCGIDEKTGNNICIEYKQDYALDDYGNVLFCVYGYVKLNNKCVYCHDVSKGGVKNCAVCQKDLNNSGIICKGCYINYILFRDNNTCIKREVGGMLDKFYSCSELKSDNGKLVCTRCNEGFSLLKIGNEVKCLILPNLYDPYFSEYYYNHYYKDIFKSNYQNYYNYQKNDYIYNSQIYLSPCKEAINLGTEEYPLYSCNKCYNVYEESDILDYDLEHSHYKKIIDQTINNRSYCIDDLSILDNCSEAIFKILKGKKIYNCTKCRLNYELLYNKELDINYCALQQEESKHCLVDFCQMCTLNNNYFCSLCITSDYEVNKYTGACVKKTEFIPIVTWKDIYRLNMNDIKEINGQLITGPSLILRGITSSEINTRHAFLIYLTFKIKYDLRNLNEIIKIPAICEIKEETEETIDYANIVDFDCIGNTTIEDENYKLINIEEDDNNSEIIINGNINEINKIINESDDLGNKITPNFTTLQIDNMLFFQINNDNITNIISSNSTFNFSLNGIINKQNIIPKINDSKCIENIQIEMNKINNKANCSFCSDENLNARLSCNLSIIDNNNSKNFSFGTSEIKFEGLNRSVYIPELNKIQFYYKTKNYVESIDVEPKNKKKNNSNNNKLVIILSSVFSVIILGIITAILIYFLKCKKKNGIEIVNNNFTKRKHIYKYLNNYDIFTRKEKI